MLQIYKLEIGCQFWPYNIDEPSCTIPPHPLDGDCYETCVPDNILPFQQSISRLDHAIVARKMVEDLGSGRAEDPIGDPSDRRWQHLKFGYLSARRSARPWLFQPVVLDQIFC